MGGYINNEMVHRNNIIEKNLIYSYLVKELFNMTLKSTKKFTQQLDKGKQIFTLKTNSRATSHNQVEKYRNNK